MNNKPNYVETTIKANIEEVWERTQTPEHHEQWDLRFSSIAYLPKKTEAEPQAFTYERKTWLRLQGKRLGKKCWYT
ncbi:hypothetical protein [Niallia circulans]|uniref:hypothetical protein n=1 Tax=Niallia circulans TaxID=1397 RepID=UPI001F2F3E3F|nr:hypothetical protein [Niallia circulans]